MVVSAVVIVVIDGVEGDGIRYGYNNQSDAVVSVVVNYEYS